MVNQKSFKSSIEEQLVTKFEEEMQEHLKTKLEEVETKKTKVILAASIIRICYSKLYNLLKGNGIIGRGNNEESSGKSSYSSRGHV